MGAVEKDVAKMLNDPRLQAVVRGACDDPFAVLGPHRHNDTRIVTAFDPAAQQMWAVIGAQTYPLMAGPDGLFAGAVAGDAPYGLRGSDGHRQWDYEDAYRFGTVISDFDEYLLGEGTHQRLWQVLGAHVMVHEGVAGTHFAVWAPNAQRASVVGDFNGWDARRHMMRRRGATGVWETFVPGATEGAAYKFDLLGPDGPLPLRADPVGFGAQHPPATASIVRDITGYGWRDNDWMHSRADKNNITAPISIYEVQLGSWRRKMGRPISYKEAADELVSYAKDMGFTHIELLPISEYPFDGSWGYQPVGLFAPTIRFGPPHEFRDLVDAAHLAGLGLLIDWVPGHFPTDAHGLGRFDGTHLYEHANPKEGFHNDWNTLIYNFGRREVANFLTANALYWLEEFHIDGLRVDAVASMLYRDYSREEGQWIPNKDGGRENYESIALLQRVNTVTYGQCPGIMTVAEESTSFPKVSAPVDSGGLGFGFKWNMGWMNDTLSYMEKEPVYRKHHHHQMTFGLAYAWSENFVLPISHDEVVHGKGSMLSKMPGDRDQQFANLRAYYGFMWGHPGKKLLFMGQEFAQRAEWNHDTEIDWACLADPKHAGMQRLVRDLNTLYRSMPALHALDCDPAGFDWLVANDTDASVFAWLRKGRTGDAPVVVISNMTPVERSYPLHLPHPGHWAEILNTDAALYGGGNCGNLGGVTTDGDGRVHVTLPPLATVFLTPD